VKKNFCYVRQPDMELRQMVHFEVESTKLGLDPFLIMTFSVGECQNVKPDPRQRIVSLLFAPSAVTETVMVAFLFLHLVGLVVVSFRFASSSIIAMIFYLT